MSTHAAWLEKSVDPRQLSHYADALAEKIQLDRMKFNFEIDAIAVMGMSGLAMGGAVSYLTDIPLILVRKANDKNHSGINVEYKYLFQDNLNYIIIDDLISTGDTIKRIVDLVENDTVYTSTKLLCIYLYHQNSTWNDRRFNVSQNVRVPIRYLSH